MENNKYSFTTHTISNQQCIIGYPPLNEIPFKNLEVGDLVTQIGTGGGVRTGNHTSSGRILDLEPPVTYAGRFIHNCEEDIGYICFLVPEEAVTGWPSRQPKPVYLAFEIGYNEQEIYNRYDGGRSIHIFQAGFTKLATDPTNVILAKWARAGAKITDCGKMCNDCAFKIQPDINGYSAAVNAALQAVTWGDTFHCHTPEYTDAGVTCKGFLYAQAYIESAAKVKLKSLMKNEQ
jgi:hypothetical protein